MRARVLAFACLCLAFQISFQLDLAPSVPRVVHTDETRITQILINLTSNAVKFTNAGRSVRISIDYQSYEDVSCCPDFAGTLSPLGVKFLVVHVTDEGMGISPENVRNLFRPYFQVSQNSTEGSGLGLFICRGLVKLLGGHICCRSQLGRGSTFNVAIPLKSVDSLAEFSSIDDAPSPEVLNLVANGKILVAEDNRVNQMVIANMLTKLGCKFDIVDDGSKACDRFIEDDYYLVLMDLMMPVMNGFEATRTIIGTTKFAIKRPAIVALTASVTDDEVRQAKEAGCLEILGKPTPIAKLQHIIYSAANSFIARPGNQPRFVLGGAQRVKALKPNLIRVSQ